MRETKTVGILFSSAGRRVELMNLFRVDALALGVPLRIVAADARPETSAACQAADACAEVPPIDDPQFVDRVLEICVRESIRLVVPLHDAELEVYAANQPRFAERGVRVVVSSLEVVRMARDKMRTAQTFACAGVPTPRTAPVADVLADPRRWPWPLIAKPRSGSASIGVQVVADAGALAAMPGDHARYLAQERLVGREYTVNLFFDQGGHLRCVIPHERLEIRAGEVSKGRTERHATLCETGRRVAAALPGAVGPLCFQAMVSPDGAVGVFEINARFGGGFPLAHRAGGTFSRWLLEELVGPPCSAHDDWQAGVTMLRYDTAVFCGLETPA